MALILVCPLPLIFALALALDRSLALTCVASFVHNSDEAHAYIARDYSGLGTLTDNCTLAVTIYVVPTTRGQF